MLARLASYADFLWAKESLRRRLSQDWTDESQHCIGGGEREAKTKTKVKYPKTYTTIVSPADATRSQPPSGVPWSPPLRKLKFNLL